MKLALLITAAPGYQQGSLTALRFAHAAVAAGHDIQRVFFFRDGIFHASTLVVTPQDEQNLPQEWQQFCEAHAIDAVVCISAGLRRGVVDAREQKRHALPGCNVSSSMSVAGLGQLADMLATADRVITFG